jgi:hypothetical protein
MASWQLHGGPLKTNIEMACFKFSQKLVDKVMSDE